LSSLKQTVEPTGVHTYIGEVDRIALPHSSNSGDSVMLSLSLFDCSRRQFLGRAVHSPPAQLELAPELSPSASGGPVEAFAPAGIIAFFCTLNAGDRRLIVAFELLVKFAGAEQSTPVGWLPFNMRGQLYSPANGCNHHEVQKC
jgi:hypothetical protein